MASRTDMLQRKIQNRQIALPSDAMSTASRFSVGSGVQQPQQLLETIDADLREASLIQSINPNSVIESSRPVIGHAIVFMKRAIRKLIRGGLGWYIMPMVHQQNQFNSYLLHAVTLEKELLSSQFKRMQETLETHANQLEAHQKHIDDIINLPTNDDQFYHDFEEKFRGDFYDICNRVSFYIPIVKEYIPNFSNARFVDIGSGRGEWMEVIRANGATDYVGVDPNEVQNQLARERGHAAVTADGVAYLKSLEAESVDMISGFQVIEHLPLSALMELMEESLRVLKKGGIILFETNNPCNLTVGADSFYLDPSHKKPLDPRLTSFMAEYCGFQQIRIIQANSNPGSALVDIEPDTQVSAALVKRVNDISWILWGPQDYAILGIKE